MGIEPTDEKEQGAVRQRQAERAAAADLALSVRAGQPLGIEVGIGGLQITQQAIKLSDGEAREAEKGLRSFAELLQVEQDWVSMQ